MPSTSYAELAVDLVNADLTTTTERLAAATAHRPWLAERVTAADLGVLRSVQGGLAALVDASANSSPRFCSSRCSTRENVAALRRRRAAGVHR